MDARTDQEWRGLFRVGGISLLLSGIMGLVAIPMFYLSGPAQIALGSSTESGLKLLQSEAAYFAGSWSIFAAVEVMGVAPALAFYFALRSINRPLVLLGAAMQMLGIVLDLSVDISIRFALLSLSNGYASAATDVQRVVYVVSAQTVNQISGVGAFVASAPLGLGIIFIAYAMLRSRAFSSMTGYVGLAGGILTIGVIPFWSLPFIASLIVGASAIPILIWSFLAGFQMYGLG